jgi:hypothetical protein
MGRCYSDGESLDPPQASHLLGMTILFGRRRELGRIEDTSFIAQGHHGFHACCAPGGQRRGEQGRKP